jgi:hypothetical protein
MPNTLSRLVLLILFAGLTGCASLNESECRRADWHGLGLQDGLQGKPLGILEDHRRACAEYAIGIDERPYLEGRAEGLREYCRIDNAFRSGRNGEQYQGVCPPAVDALFRRYNAAAYDVYRLRKDIDGLDSQIDQQERKLRNKDLSDKDRQRLRDDIRDLDRRRARLRDDLNYRESTLDRLTDEARRRN